MDIKLYHPHPKQKEIHNLLNAADAAQDAGTPKDKLPYIITVVSGRQAGKTQLAMNQMLIWSVRYPKSMIWFISPSDTQNMKVYREFAASVHSSGLVKSTTGTRGSFTIAFHNGTRIEFKSAKSRDSLRGASVDYMIVDEAAYVDKRIFEEVLLGTMAVKGKRILLLSTPRGSNWFQFYFNKGQTGNSAVQKNNPLQIIPTTKMWPVSTRHKEPRPTIAGERENSASWIAQKFRSFRFLSSDNPVFNSDMLPTYKELLGSDRFGQEYMAEFNDKAGIFRGLKEVSTGLHLEKAEYGMNLNCGIDIGLKNDAFVATIMSDTGKVVHIEYVKGITSPRIRETIKQLQNIYNINHFMLEQNNQGLPIIQELTNPASPDYMTNISGFITTHSSKERIIFQLSAAIEAKKIELLKRGEQNADLMLDELGAFVSTIGPNGHLTMAGAAGSGDDCVMSLAIAYECTLSNRYVGMVIM